MASKQRSKNTDDDVYNAQAFIMSLGLSTSNATQLSAILEDIPTAASPQDQEKGEVVDPLAQRDLFRNVACVVFGKEMLVEQSLIDNAVKESWSESCWQSPSCIIKPTSSEQVAQAMKIIKFFQAPFAIRSGGHSPNPGSSSIQDGVLIDLAELNKMSISEDRSTVSVGPGARWGKVYEYLNPYNVTAVGGRIPQVGVGGLMLGGGISLFTGEYGLSIDNIANIEIVLADGSIVDANLQENSDLFWALKGGGPNFGIVTRYDLRTIPVKDIWYQLSVYSPEQALDLFDAFAEYQLSEDTKASVGMIITLTSVAVGLIYCEPVETPDVFQPFYDIPPLATPVPSTLGTVQALNQISARHGSVPGRHDYRGASSKVDPELYKMVYETWKDQATSLQENTGATMTFVLQHIPKNVVDKGEANGGNALGLEPIVQQWWTTLINWTDPAHDDMVRSSVTVVTQKWEELGKARGSHLPFIYMNDASRDQDPLSTYAPANIQKLHAVAKKYDPGRVFQGLQHGGFLLSRSGHKV